MAEFTLEALKDEIVADSQGLGYKNSAVANDWKDDQVIADLFNAKIGTMIQEQIETAAVKAVVDAAEFQTLAPSEESYLVWVTDGEFVETASPLIQAALFKGGAAEIWGAQDVSGQKILDLATIPASRAMQLWREGISITAGNVGRAFNLLP